MWQMMIPDLLINCFDYRLWFAIFCIVFSPFYWNVVRSFNDIYSVAKRSFCATELHYFALY